MNVDVSQYVLGGCGWTFASLYIQLAAADVSETYRVVSVLSVMEVRHAI